MANRSEVKTSDLTLSTYLKVEGHEAELAMGDERQPNGQPIIEWRFADESGELYRLISDFNDDLAEVEPKAFHRMLTDNRRELFAFIEEIKANA